MEAENFKNVSSASGRPRNTSGVIQPKFKGVRTKEANDVNPSLRAGENEMRYFSSSVLQKRWQISPSSVFCFIQAFSRLDDASSQ